ncbi:PAAR domain-containing protein [Ewingella americana]|uniref:PAAR domain-containing protein n=1 Tax=Ewingella americana TaxID=41202 RepID=UPI0012AE597B|nr:PAAR domain-containing protein [Ewingella americana]MRT03050.1 PAAR domain-containing protein [Ewingella americana]
MAKGYYLVVEDETTCGGIIIEGDTTHTLFGRAVAREEDRVTCGKHPGTYFIIGHIPGDKIHGRNFAGTLHSKSSCPCEAEFIPSMVDDTYDLGSQEPKKKPASEEQKAPALSSYVTGEKPSPSYVPDYPATALINTHTVPDLHLRNILKSSNQDIALLTPDECIEVLSSWGMIKAGWVSITQTESGVFVINYGTNIKDVVTTSMIITKLGSFGIKATTYINHKGTELIKISGYPGIRKILNAPVFAAKNPKIVDIGIGKYGLKNSIISGARITFYVAAAYRTLDFILNDEITLTKFIGSLATDIIKIGVVSSVVFVAGVILVTPFIALNLAIVVGVGFLSSYSLNILDEKFGLTDKIIYYLDSSQQEFVEKAREMEKGFWDLGTMLADGMLEKGREFIESETKRYLKESVDAIFSRRYYYAD